MAHAGEGVRGGVRTRSPGRAPQRRQQTPPQQRSQRARRPEPEYNNRGMELNADGYYEAKDVKGKWWPVTLLARNSDGETYTAHVYDGTTAVDGTVGKRWPSVHPANVRDAPGPHTPTGIEADPKRRNMLVLQDKVEFDAPGRGRVMFSLSESPHGGRCSFLCETPKTKHDGRGQLERRPDFLRAALCWDPRPSLELACESCGQATCKKGTDCDNARKVVDLPHPAWALIPSLRRLFDFCGVGHDLGADPPKEVGEWTRIESTKRHGFSYWHNSATDESCWAEPPREDVDLARALLQSEQEYRGRSADLAEQERQRLARNLRDRGLQEHPTPADGHCQFRAIAFHVYASDGEHRRVRQEVVAQMRQEPERYRDFCSGKDGKGSKEDRYKEYLEAMGDERTEKPEWGDHQTLKAAADLYNLKVWVVSSRAGQGQLVCIVPHAPTSASTPSPAPAGEGDGAAAAAAAAPSPTRVPDDVREVWVSFLEEPTGEHFNPATKLGATSGVSSPRTPAGAGAASPRCAGRTPSVDRDAYPAGHC